jgi:cephalosporin hydroxylase
MGFGEDPIIEMDVTVGLAASQITDAFHGVYYAKMAQPRWFGAPILKCPVDLWRYQEILCQTTPDVIIETGTAQGGSALFLATICQLLGRGRVITIDMKAPPSPPVHPGITYLTGNAVDPEMVLVVSHLAQMRLGEADTSDRTNRVMVILDSDHSAEHVLAELEAYAGLVTLGCYLVVEDTNINGHPVGSSHGPGPWEAIEAWLPLHPEFERDTDIETRHILTFNPNGYLRRRA